MFKVARQVAKDRAISTVDPQARPGHKSSARGFDGYKGHIAIDPHSELIADTVVSAGNVEDAVDQRLSRHPAARRQLMTYGFISSSTIRTSPTASSAGSPGP